MDTRDTNILRAIDYPTLLIYLALVFIGWVSIYAAGYDFDQASIYDLTERSGKQLLWIGLSFLLGLGILFIDARYFDLFSIFFYAVMILALLLTIFIAPDIKGSHSWIVLGPISLQPAEFAKCATALALSSLLSSHNFSLQRVPHLLVAILLFMFPAAIIVLQQETGSALVYLAFFFVLYREGMNASILVAGICAVFYFVTATKYDGVMWQTTEMGWFIIALFMLVFMLVMLARIKYEAYPVRLITLYLVAIFGVALLVNAYWIALPLHYLLLAVVSLLAVYALFRAIQSRTRSYLVIVLFLIGSLSFSYSVGYVFERVLEPHQQMRIKVSLGIEEDLRGAGYNVNQSKIAIGSGGLFGKGMLNGTQTKLKYVPEQDTDFIFCTIGEEEGFVGSAFVLLLFAGLIIRIILLAERQSRLFARVYCYSVASILFFHLFVNIGMVLGLTPVIGIPLPFISYGGSSLWGFTILLFVMLRIDAQASLVTCRRLPPK